MNSITIIFICFIAISLLLLFNERRKIALRKLTNYPAPKQKTEGATSKDSLAFKRWLKIHYLTPAQKMKLFASWGLSGWCFYSDTLKQRFLIFAINRKAVHKKINKIGFGEIPFTAIEVELDEFNKLPKTILDMNKLMEEEAAEARKNNLALSENSLHVVE